jgi:hypothetical protein
MHDIVSRSIWSCLNAEWKGNLAGRMTRVKDTNENVIILTVTTLVVALDLVRTNLIAALKLTRTTIIAVLSLILILVRMFLTNNTFVSHTGDGCSQASRQRRGQ